MLLARIRVGDLVEVDKKGRRFIAAVQSVEHGGLRILPLGRENYYTATPREIVTHWRKARGGERSRSSTQPATCAAQLDLGGGFRS